MKQVLFFLWCCLCNLFLVYAQPNVSDMKDPLAVAALIGDKLIRDTPFKYKLKIDGRNKLLNGLHHVDFGRTFGTHQPAVAYAYTHLTVKEDLVLDMQVGHTDECKIWLNGALVYEKKGQRPLQLHYEERSVELPEHFEAQLRKGANSLLIKSASFGGEWVVYLQPPSTRGAVLAKAIDYPAIGLEGVPHIDKSVSALTNWLMLGPFFNHQGQGIDVAYPAEKEIAFGSMYDGNKASITWTIPKLEVLGDVIDPLPWGTNYNWNYHNGGVAWAMQFLAAATGEKKYDNYATDFCDFHLNGASFVEYQVKTMRAVHAANSKFLFTPLLDFTLAPALPFIYKIRKEPAFVNRDNYVQYIGQMLTYARNEQIRLPESNIYTRLTPEKYTTWVDDMFMGIPFLIQAAQYAPTEEERNFFLDDAASQALNFNDQVWNPDANLYCHARYSESAVKLPHWSRANGWGIWAVTEVLKVLPKNHPKFKPLLEHYKKHVVSLVALQNKNGFWLQVLDRPDSREEVSGTAIFTMAIARGISNGWLNAGKYTPYVLKGWDALKTQIEPDGTVHNICYGTMCSEDVNYYLNRPFYDNDTHGLFAVLFACLEVKEMMGKAGVKK